MLIPILIIASLLVILLVSSKYLRNPASVNPQLKHIPGPKPEVFFGNTRQLSNPRYLAPSLHDWAKTYGDVYVFYLFSRPLVVVSDPKVIRKLTLDREGYQRGPMPYSLVSEFTGRTLFLTDGTEWKHRRGMLNNLFQIKNVHSLAPIIVDRCAKLASLIEPASLRGEFTEVVKLFHPLTLDVIGVFLLGRRLNALESLDAPAPTLASRISAYFHHMTPQLRSLVFTNKSLIKFIPSYRRFQKQHASPYWQLISQLVEERANELAKGATPEKFLIDALLDPESGLSHLEICHELSGFILAGHETTANSLALVIAELLQNPDKLALVVKELDQVFPGIPTTTELVQIDDFKRVGELKYLLAVIKETLRLHPLVSNHWGDLVVDRQIGQYFVPAGTMVLASIWNSQYNENYYPEPKKFLPERFLAEENTDEVASSQSEDQKLKNPVQEAWMPFYSGPHLCIGMNIAMLELKMVLAFLLKNFVLSVPDGYQPVYASLLTVTVTNGLPLKVKRRTL